MVIVAGRTLVAPAGRETYLADRVVTVVLRRKALLSADERTVDNSSGLPPERWKSGADESGGAHRSPDRRHSAVMAPR